MISQECLLDNTFLSVSSSSDSSDSSSVHLGCSILFTKKHVLKYALGDAHKGWVLVKRADSGLEGLSVDEDFKDAVEHLDALRKGEIDNVELPLVFSRRLILDFDPNVCLLFIYWFSILPTNVVQCSYNVRTMFVQCSYNGENQFVQCSYNTKAKFRTILYEPPLVRTIIVRTLYELISFHLLEPMNHTGVHFRS